MSHEKINCDHIEAKREYSTYHNHLLGIELVAGDEDGELVVFVGPGEQELELVGLVVVFEVLELHRVQAQHQAFL